MSSSPILPPLMRTPFADTEPAAMRTQAMPEPAPDAPASARPSSTPAKPSEPHAAETKSTNATVRKTAIDWETGAMVYRVIDEHSGATLSQSPDEALLRLRAYARQSGPDPVSGVAGATNGIASGSATGATPDPMSAPTGITPRPSKTV